MTYSLDQAREAIEAVLDDPDRPHPAGIVAHTSYRKMFPFRKGCSCKADQYPVYRGVVWFFSDLATGHTLFSSRRSFLDYVTFLQQG